MWLPNGQSGGAIYLRDPITGATGIADQFGNVSTDGGRTYTSNLGMPVQQFMMAGSNESALRQSNAPAAQQGAPTQGWGGQMVQQPTQGWGGQTQYGGGGQAPGGYPQMPGYPGQSGQSPFGNFGHNGMGTIKDDTIGMQPHQQGGPYMQYGGGQTQYGGNAGMYGGAPGQRPGQASGMQIYTPMAGEGMNYQRQAQSNPYANINVPLANQMSPSVWDSLSPMGKQLAYGAIGQTGQDPNEYENQLNKARPQGQAPRMTSTRYAPAQGMYGIGY